jgi:glycosyltransferase involved in cell wall biosynthesis
VAGAGPEEKRLRELAARLGIASSVEFFGKVDEQKKAELLSKAHIVLFPGTREGWGLVVLEANACGTPVIGYDVPGLRDSIRDGINGFTVPSGDSAAMAARIISLISDRRALEKLSASAKAYSKAFTWDRCADGFLSVLEADS